jgi:hypothetical protein
MQSAPSHSFVEDCSALPALHSPVKHGGGFNVAEDQILDDEADEDDGKESGEDGRDVEHVFVFVDIPTKSALAGGDAGHQFRGDQRSPGEGPADLEAGQDRRERGRDQNLGDERDASETVVAPPMRSVCDTDRKPEWVLSATAHSTECQAQR